MLVDELKQRQETVPAEQDLGGSARNQAEGTKGTQWGTPELQEDEQGLSAKGRWEVSGPRKGEPLSMWRGNLEYGTRAVAERAGSHTGEDLSVGLTHWVNTLPVSGDDLLTLGEGS